MGVRSVFIQEIACRRDDVVKCCFLQLLEIIGRWLIQPCLLCKGVQYGVAVVGLHGSIRQVPLIMDSNSRVLMFSLGGLDFCLGRRITVYSHFMTPKEKVVCKGLYERLSLNGDYV